MLLSNVTYKEEYNNKPWVLVECFVSLRVLNSSRTRREQKDSKRRRTHTKRANSHVALAHHHMILYLLRTKCHCKWPLDVQHSLQAQWNPPKAEQNCRIMEDDLFRTVGKTCLACLVFSGLIIASQSLLIFDCRWCDKSTHGYVLGG